MSYLEGLRQRNIEIQNKIESSLEKYQSYPVGTGYIDIITKHELSEKLLHDLSNAGIAVNAVTWWCHSTEENKDLYGCPHGMGGPKCNCCNGYYSEMGLDYETYEISETQYNTLETGTVTQEEIHSINQAAWNYIREFSNNERFSNCFTPALWLHVPDEWKRIKYLNR
ncbi:hypothetical protein [Cohnella candidum]|uniref:hypothetical protein n=1 Tax=Cohnella candidum TaxID=2674991 RepID=UPI0013DDBE50|nr:hypothetical protein [Cohnella candidum]